MAGTNRSQRGRREFDGVDSSGWDGQPIDYGGAPPLLPPVIDSVNNIDQFAGDAFQDALNLSGGAVDPVLTTYTVTDYADVGGGSPPAYPGPNWTTYTGGGGEEGLTWDPLGNENGPLAQPPAAGPYTGSEPYLNSGGYEGIPGGADRWKRVLITVANAAGSDSDHVFVKPESF